jgi:hypothetical protein
MFSKFRMFSKPVFIRVFRPELVKLMFRLSSGCTVGQYL